ncbi:hypothetical protein GCM10010129_80540 [Streptomyces fumigatiscleroticus]|nr:hypothetical protein GCM10010129_80540 [Streptomyces fumigatiscleroticus]
MGILSVGEHTLTRRTDRDTHEAALADTADHILRRSRPHTPTAATATATTTAADGTGAAGRPGTADHPVGTGPVRPSAEELEDTEDSLDALEAPAPDHADTDRETGRQGGQAAAGYALYDAGEEAEHW